MSRYAMIALDIDGTLLNSDKAITPRTRRAITLAQHSGALVTLATGRTWRDTLPIAQALCIQAPLVIGNGALIASPATGQILTYRPLNRSMAAGAVHLLSGMGLTPFASRCDLTGPDLFYEQVPATPETSCLFGRDPQSSRQVPDLAGFVIGIEPLKVMALDRTTGILAAADRLRRELRGAFQVLVTNEGPGYSLLEVAAPGVNKATALERLASLNRVDPSEVVAFGDNYNDVEMLQWAGLGVAMGNAPADVKAAAHMITATNDEEGVAWFLEQHILRAA